MNLFKTIFRLEVGLKCHQQFRLNFENTSNESLEVYLNNINYNVNGFIKENISSRGGIKVSSTISIKFKKYKDNKVENIIGHFHSDPSIILPSSDFNFIDTVLNTFEKRVEDFNKEGSDWIFEGVTQLKVNIGNYNPVRGSSHFKLPPFIVNKHAVLNIQNEDNYCFLWCILAYLYPNNNPTRVSSYRQHFSSLNIKGMSFPPTTKDII